MADDKGNVKEEIVVKLSADIYDFDNSMEKADATLDEQKSNVRRLQRAYQALYDWVRSTNRQFKNTGKRLDVSIESFGNPYERYLSKNKVPRGYEDAIDADFREIDDKPVEKFANNTKYQLESISSVSRDVAKDMKDNFKYAIADMKSEVQSVSEEMKNEVQSVSEEMVQSHNDTESDSLKSNNKMLKQKLKLLRKMQNVVRKYNPSVDTESESLKFNDILLQQKIKLLNKIKNAVKGCNPNIDAENKSLKANNGLLNQKLKLFSKIKNVIRGFNPRVDANVDADTDAGSDSDSDTDAKNMSKELLSSKKIANSLRHILQNSKIPEISKELLSAKKIAGGLRYIMQSLNMPDLSKHTGYYSKEADKIRKKIAKLEAENKFLADKKVPVKGISSEDIEFVERQIERLISRLDAYRQRQEEIKNSDATKQQMAEYSRLSDSIERTTKCLVELKAQRDSMYTSGATLPKYGKNEDAIALLRAELASVEVQGETVARSIAKNIGTQLKNALGKGVQAGVNIAKTGISNLINTVKATKKHFSHFGKSLKSLLGGDAFLGSPMSPKGVVMFSQMWLQFSMISAIFGEVKRSIDNFAKSFEPFNDALSRTVNSLRLLGAQITATFEPLVVVAVPYVEKLLDVLTKTADTLAQFTARLTGNQMYTKASKGNYNYAESLDKTSSGAKKATKAVKEYQNTVLGFDQLNKLNGVDEEAEIGVDDAKLNKAQTQSTRLNKIADAIHKALSKKDYKGAGKAVADGVNEAFSWIKNVAGWEANSKRVTGALRHVIDFVNSLADEFKGTKAGQAIGDVANTVIESLKLLTEPTKGINFGLIGTRLGQMIKGAIDTVHWDSLGVSIVQSIQGMLAFVNGIISVPDFWVSIGTAIANGIQGMIKAYDPSKVADLVVNLVHGIAELLVTAFGGDNAGIGAEIGAKLAETVNKVFAGLSPEQIANGINTFVNTLTSAINTFIKNVDWSTVFSTIGTALKELDWLGIIEIIALFAIPKIPGIVLPLLAPVGTALMSGIGKLFSSGAISKALSGFAKSIATFFTTGKGASIFSSIGKLFSGGGISKALSSFVKSIGTFFKTGKGASIFSSIGAFFTTGKGASILSGLGTLLASAKGLILKGLTALGSAIAAHPFIAVIIGIVVLLVGFVITHWEEVKTFFINTWNKICEIAGVVGDKLKEIWGNITTWFSDIKTKAGDVVDNVGKWFSDLPDKISEGVHGIFDTVTGWFSDLKTDAEGVVSDIVSFFTSLPDRISEGWGKAKTWVSEHLPFGKEKISVSSVSAYNIPKLAGGGVVGDGQLFIANENGPELVGQHNGQTAVMNNMQIVTAVTRGVRDAMAEVLMTFSHNGGDGDGGDVVIMVDSEELARATLRGQRKLDKRNNPSVSFA